MSWPTPQSCSHHKQLWWWEIEHWDLCSLWNVLIEGGGCSKRVDNSLLQEGGQREWHVPVWGLLFTWLALLCKSCLYKPHVCYQAFGNTQEDPLEMIIHHPFLFLWPSVAQKQPLRWLWERICADTIQYRERYPSDTASTTQRLLTS